MVVGKNGWTLLWPMTRTKWPCILLFLSSASERWKLLTFTVEAGKKARAVCLYVEEKTFWWSLGAPHNMAKRRRSFFSPTRCLWEHSTFSSICFFITVQAWTNESSKSPRDFCCFLKHLRFLSTIYQKTKFSFISSGKEWKWSLSLFFFFC